MSRLPIVDVRTIEKVLLRLGFEPVLRKGSHVFYRHPHGRTTTVLYHPGRDLARPLVCEIDLTPGQFRQEVARVWAVPSTWATASSSSRY